MLFVYDCITAPVMRISSLFAFTRTKIQNRSKFKTDTRENAVKKFGENDVLMNI